MMDAPIVPADRLAEAWPKVAPWIERAIARNQGDENPLDVLIALARGQYLLWYAEHYAAVIQVTKFPRQTVAAVLYCGGTDLKAMAAAFEYGKRWAKAHGVDVIRVYGRKGWERLLHLDARGAILQVRL